MAVRAAVLGKTEEFIRQQPKVSGSNLDMVLGRNLENIVNKAITQR